VELKEGGEGGGREGGGEGGAKGRGLGRSSSVISGNAGKEREGGEGQGIE